MQRSIDYYTSLYPNGLPAALLQELAEEAAQRQAVKDHKTVCIALYETNDLQHELLQAIMTKGLKLAKEEYRLLDVSEVNNLNLDQAAKILCFGELSYQKLKKKLNIVLSLNRAQQIEGTDLLYTSSLEVIKNDQNKKMQFWKALQSLL